MTFLECVLSPTARVSFSSMFPAPPSSWDSPPFGHAEPLRSPLPAPIVPSAPAGALAAEKLEVRAGFRPMTRFPGGAFAPPSFSI
jgi:hypothetical protein